MKDKIPSRYIKVKENYPDILNSYEGLGEAVHSAGPLDAKTRALVKLAISTGAGLEGAIASHARKASKIGATPDEMKHVAFLSLPTIGFPKMMIALKVIEQLEEKA
ncbi:MAG: carboxymuconolactone decarboxylase family protein [Candidatus Kapaibacterium sp.]